MNEQPENATPAPIEAKGISGILGNSEGFVRKLLAASNPWRDAGFLMLLALGGAALYGFAVGWFVDWQVAIVDAAKAAGIILFSYLLCLPTLYVFASLGGCRVGFGRLALIGFVAMSAIGCILAALAPVLWLFAVSTESMALFILLIFALILIAVILGARTLSGIVKARAVNRGSGLSAWFAIFLFVALQMITVIRPMLTTDAKSKLEQSQGKCFFLKHFSDSMGEATGAIPRRATR